MCSCRHYRKSSASCDDGNVKGDPAVRLAKTWRVKPAGANNSFRTSHNERATGRGDREEEGVRAVVVYGHHLQTQPWTWTIGGGDCRQEGFDDLSRDIDRVLAWKAHRPVLSTSIYLVSSHRLLTRRRQYSHRAFISTALCVKNQTIFTFSIIFVKLWPIFKMSSSMDWSVGLSL